MMACECSIWHLRPIESMRVDVTGHFVCKKNQKDDKQLDGMQLHVGFLYLGNGFHVVKYQPKQTFS